MKNGFTMIELVYVIVVLGILSAIALPKFAVTRQIADVSKGRSDVSAIRSAILTERQSRLIRGDNTFIPNLCNGGGTLFTGSTTPGRGRLLQYGIVPGNSNGQWSDASGGACTSFNFRATDAVVVPFTYFPVAGVLNGVAQNAGTFTCDRTAGGDVGAFCRRMID
jgi:general secretion pathway protein G